MWLPLQLLSVLCWAGVGVLDSALVRHYEKNPAVLQWHQSFYTLGVVVCLALLFPVQSSWAPVLLVSGLSAYLGDRLFFLALDRVDVSVTNITWATLAIFLSIGGMIFFGERWSVWQGAGVVLVLAGVGLLSLWGKHVKSWKSFGLLVLLAAVYTPFYLVQKHAIASGAGVLVTFFWQLVGREIFAGSVPLFLPRLRAEAFGAFRRHTISFPILNAAVVALFLAGTSLTALAYQTGPISLVSVVSNVQPFMTLFLAWALLTLLPRFASKELLTAQSVRVKVISFLVVLAGLILLGASL